MYILVVQKSSIIAISRGRICEFDRDMNLIRKGERIFGIIFSLSNTLKRLFRQVIYAIKKIDTDSFIISSGNGFYYLDICKLSITNIRTPKDFKKCLNIGLIDIKSKKYIIYSDYRSNLEKNRVAIYIAPLNSLDDYELIHTFTKGSINHIHSFYQDRQSKEIFFNVGDYCESVGIWKLNLETLNPEPYLIGSQEYRSVFCWIEDSNYIFATDFPGGNNRLNKIKISDENKEVECIGLLNGPVIYGVETEEYTYFATSAEPKKALGLISYIPILPIFQKSYLYRYEKVTASLECISSAKKDWFNPYLFGFGSFQFPHTEVNSALYVNKVGLTKKTKSNLISSSSSTYDVYEL